MPFFEALYQIIPFSGNTIKDGLLSTLFSLHLCDSELEFVELLNRDVSDFRFWHSKRNFHSEWQFYLHYSSKYPGFVRFSINISSFSELYTFPVNLSPR